MLILNIDNEWKGEKKNPLLGLYLQTNSKKRVSGLNSLYVASPKMPSQEFSLKRSQESNDHRLLAQVTATSLCRNPPSTQSQRLPKGQILIYVLTVTITKHMRKTAIVRKSQQKQQVVDLDPQIPQTLELSDIKFKIILTYLMTFLKHIENISGVSVYKSDFMNLKNNF